MIVASEGMPGSMGVSFSTEYHHFKSYRFLSFKHTGSFQRPGFSENILSRIFHQHLVCIWLGIRSTHDLRQLVALSILTSWRNLTDILLHFSFSINFNFYQYFKKQILGCFYQFTNYNPEEAPLILGLFSPLPCIAYIKLLPPRKRKRGKKKYFTRYYYVSLHD